MSNQAKGISWAIFTGVCWAVLAIGLKYALQFTHTGTIVWLRMLVAFLLLLGFLLVYRPPLVRKTFSGISITGILAGLFLAGNYFGYLHGLELSTANNAQIMIQMGPIFLLFAGVFYFHEELRWIQWLGIALAFTGFVFFNWDQVLIALGDQKGRYLLGNVWLMGAALIWAFYAILQKIMIQRGWNPQQVNLLLFGVATVVLTPLVTWSDFNGLSAFQWFVLFLLGLNSVVAYGAFAEALNLIPASHVSLIICCNPLLTILLMDLMTRYDVNFVSAEPVAWRGYLGAGLVVSGVAIAVSLRKRIQKKVVTRPKLL